MIASAAALFPGQGSQRPGLRELVLRHRPELAELACSELEVDPFEHLEVGTRFVQPVIYCADLAYWDLVSREEDFVVMAGHSLGEIAALAAAGALDERDGLRLVIERARLTAHEAERGKGGMVAVLASLEEVRPVAESFGLFIAADNSPKQVVLSGDRHRLEPVCMFLRERGTGCTVLDVSGAFHSPLMRDAAVAFREVLDTCDFTTPSVPVMSGVTAACFGEDVRDRLADALTSTVRWREVLMTLPRRGVTRCVEVGPGKAMIGLARRTLSGVEVRASCSLEEMYA